MTAYAGSCRHRVLVTGATGIMGRRLLPALVADGHRVFGLAPSGASVHEVVRVGATPVTGDVLDRASVFDAVKGVRPTIVVHQATALSGGFKARRLDEAMATPNRLRAGARNLLDASERHGVQRVIALSIAFAYEHAGPAQLDETAPLDVRAPGRWASVARAIAELEDIVMGAVQVQGLVLRHGAFYGPGTAISPDGSVGRLVRRRRLPVIGDGRGQTPLVHIDDAIGATLDALDGGWGIFNIADDVPAPARAWIPALAAELEAPAPRHIPAWAAQIAAGRHAVRTMTTQRGVLNAKAKAELGWRPEYPDWRVGFGSLRAGPRDRGGALEFGRARSLGVRRARGRA